MLRHYATMLLSLSRYAMMLPPRRADAMLICRLMLLMPRYDAAFTLSPLFFTRFFHIDMLLPRFAITLLPCHAESLTLHASFRA